MMNMQHKGAMGMARRQGDGAWSASSTRAVRSTVRVLRLKGRTTSSASSRAWDRPPRSVALSPDPVSILPPTTFHTTIVRTPWHADIKLYRQTQQHPPPKITHLASNINPSRFVSAKLGRSSGLCAWHAFIRET